MHRFIAILAAVLLPVIAAAQERPNTILVLDGSGSMWGQIDGVNKIVIARDVVGGILDEFPQDQNLGLTVYGHRTRGDCTDIETVVAPGTGTLPAIRDAVNGINPRGKTPMTDAVIAAAEALRYTEERATVILVSDGIETCNPDPCAAARLLEEAGIDFTAHVVGFDVTDPEALAQMQCLADETGGTFTTAATAEELTQALTTVAVAPEPEPITVTGLTYRAQMGENGPFITTPLDWEILQDGTRVGAPVNAATFENDLPPGTYTARATRPEDGLTRETDFTVEDSALNVIVMFPAPTLEITLEARLDSETGDMITDPVIWTVTGPDGAEEVTGNPITEVRAPGSYEVTAYWTAQEISQSRQFTAIRVPRTVTLVFDAPLPSATIIGPDTAPAGSTVEVGWSGPENDDDFIAVDAPDGTRWVNYTYIEKGNPVDLLMPAYPGEYELRYMTEGSYDILASQPITVTEVEATLTAPESANAGDTVEIGWTGPDYKDDFIAVETPDGERWINYVYTKEGSPADLLMPTEPGTYEIRYVMNQDYRVLTSQTIEVTDVQATLEAPDSAAAGSTIEVGWTGPDYDDDFIVVETPDGDRWINYTYTKEGAPLDLQLPIQPGTYEIRYVLNQGYEVLAARTIEVTDVQASLTAPEEATVGSTVMVGWDGPDYDNDLIVVETPDGDRWINYRYTRDGSPAELLMPTEPGTYELRYVANQGYEVLATRTITLSEVTATLSVPAEAAAGGMIEVAWTGPDYDNDLIVIETPDGERWQHYSYTRNGTPLELQMPTEPGDYEIRYVLGQGYETIAAQPITVTAVQASVTAPTEAVAGSTIQVAWDGPGYQNDLIVVETPDGDRWINYAYTRNGNPAEVLMPTEPGEYEIRYALGQDRSVLAAQPITITPLKVTLTAPATAPIGASVAVGWDGPDYRNDFIGVARPDEDRHINYGYTRNGNPTEVAMPSEPGIYELRYYLDQGRRIMARAEIEVTDLKVQMLAPDTAPAGGTVTVGHDGPDYQGDYIGIFAEGADRHTTYANTNRGNPLEITVPDAPGTYELRYVMRQDGKVLGTAPLVVE